MATLYEIRKEIADCLDVSKYTYDAKCDRYVDTETGEVFSPETIEKAIRERYESLQIDRHEKLHSLGKVYMNRKSDAEQFAKMKNYFAAKEKAARRDMAWIKDTMAYDLDGEKMKETEFSVFYIPSDPLEIEDGASIPNEFLIQQEPKVDRAGIRKALQEGAIIPGCKLAKRSNIQIR
ncbi:MAG: siphovirus Gp157 family protein [Selenomonadaceae bacterium]|jgi:hypothetical protein|nr:siphovirus Gp157 family protein [Selenomonadaceae bacterium]